MARGNGYVSQSPHIIDAEYIVERVIRSRAGKKARRKVDQKKGYDRSSSDDGMEALRAAAAKDPVAYATIAIADDVNPYSGYFDSRAIFKGKTKYDQQYKDHDKHGKRWKGMKGSVSTASSWSSSSSAKKLRKKPKSHWVKSDYKTRKMSSSSSTSMSSSSYAYESYSCDAMHCDKPTAHRHDTTAAGRMVIMCPRAVHNEKMAALPPVEQRGYKGRGSSTSSSSSSSSKKMRRQKSVDRYGPQVARGRYDSRSMYSYSYSSCSQSSCSIGYKHTRGYKTKGNHPITSSSSSSSSKKIARRSTSSKKFRGSRSSGSTSSKKLARRSTSSNDHGLLATGAIVGAGTVAVTHGSSSSTSSSKKPGLFKRIGDHFTSSSSKTLSSKKSHNGGNHVVKSRSGLNTKATGSNVIDMTKRIEESNGR